MTGSGTVGDPFVVDNWQDFVSIDTVGEVYVKWKDIENKVIDFNDIKPEGFAENVILPRYIDFNGWLFKNFYANHESYAFYVKSLSYPSYIKNLIFENFYLLNTMRLFYGINLENCIISGIFNSSSTANMATSSNITNCSFNIKATATRQFVFLNGNNSKVKNSDVILDAIAETINILSGDKSSINNCRFSGKIQASKNSVFLLGGSGNVYNLDSSRPLYYTGEGISVYNSDFSEVDANSSANLKACTADELKNPEFLYNLGFPIGID